MAWKKKERPLTLDEAIVQAKQTLAPYWRGSEPVFTAFLPPHLEDGELIKTSQNPSFYLLDPAYRDKFLCLGFFNPWDFTGPSVMKFLDYISTEYHFFKVLPFGIIPPSFLFLRNSNSIQDFQESEFPIVLDHERSISNATQSKRVPEFVLIKNGSIVASFGGNKACEQTEEYIQKSLRATDRGLPLRPVTPEQNYGDWKSELILLNESSNSSFFSGNWKKTEHYVTPLDSSAEIKFSIHCKKLGIVIGMETINHRGSYVSIVIPKPTLFEDSFAPIVESDENGNRVFNIKTKKLYHCLTNVTFDVSFQFLTAETDDLHIYGITYVR